MYIYIHTYIYVYMYMYMVMYIYTYIHVISTVLGGETDARAVHADHVRVHCFLLAPRFFSKLPHQS